MKDRFAFEKSWGAELIPGGGARFRLWAPSVASLDLIGPDIEIAMERGDDGWFETVTDRIAPGNGYGFRLPDGLTVPDPAARAQTADVHGLSRLVDPNAFRWRYPEWRGRPWEEAVIYELHTGAFSDEGTFRGIETRLAHLAETGVTAVEIMPVAQFGGARGWGYDGTLLYAPHSAYGGPEGLKSLVDAAHRAGLMVILDVVYNHFGPDGNYLPLYASAFFDESRHTPWGAGIAYGQPAVRDFFIENVLYWLEEYRLDGLRFDAINEIQDQSDEPILDEIARTVRSRFTNRYIHLTTEDDRNITRLHERDPDGRPRLFTAEWNDDFHHAAHVAATHEAEGYYMDFAADAVPKLVRALAEGYVYQGEASEFWEGKARGVPSTHLPPTAFVNFIQNHDQVGNRAFSERLTDLAPPECVEALTAILLLSPQIPLMFMGDEWGETRPFSFFTDFHGELAEKVREGRRREFRHFARFADEESRAHIPDPNDPATFEASRLDWTALAGEAAKRRRELIGGLLATRATEIVPRLSGMPDHSVLATDIADRAFRIRWRLGDGSALVICANVADTGCQTEWSIGGRTLYRSHPDASSGRGLRLPSWSVVAALEEGPSRR